MKTLSILFSLLLFMGSRQTVNQPLLILVRDGEGHPLQGITIRLSTAGRPHEPYDNCVTDTAGHCRFLIPPGAYLVHFDGGWHGQTFIPAEPQNPGVPADEAGVGGGFGVYLEPANAETVITFVIGIQNHQLVPLWDLSRDPAQVPQPYLPDTGQIGGVNATDSGISLDSLIDSPPAGVEEFESIRPAPTLSPENEAEAHYFPPTIQREEKVMWIVMSVILVTLILLSLAFVWRLVSAGRKNDHG